MRAVNFCRYFTLVTGIFSATPVLAQIVPAASAVLTDAGAVTESASLILARQIVATILPPDKREEMLTTLLRSFQDQMSRVMLSEVKNPSERAVANARMRTMHERLMPVVNAHMPDLLEAMAIAYTHEFSESELLEIRRFSATPVGIHYLSQSMAIVSDPAVAAANQRYLAAIQAMLPAEREAALRELVAYRKAHPTR